MVKARKFCARVAIGSRSFYIPASHLPPNLAHDVRNASKTETLKAVVFGLYEKDKPQIVPAK